MTVQFDLFGGYVDMTPIEAKVMQILECNPEARGSDKTLLLEVWRIDGLDEILDGDTLERFREWFLSRASYPESVTRARRRFKDRYPPDPEAQQRRERREEWFRSRHRRR